MLIGYPVNKILSSLQAEDTLLGSILYSHYHKKNLRLKPFLKVDGQDDPVAVQGLFLWLRQGADAREKKTRVMEAAFYAAQVSHSFFIMLLFMTYNG